jgi:hypothetical protein
MDARHSFGALSMRRSSTRLASSRRAPRLVYTNVTRRSPNCAHPAPARATKLWHGVLGFFRLARFEAVFEGKSPWLGPLGPGVRRFQEEPAKSARAVGFGPGQGAALPEAAQENLLRHVADFAQERVSRRRAADKSGSHPRSAGRTPRGPGAAPPRITVQQGPGWAKRGLLAGSTRDRDKRPEKALRVGIEPHCPCPTCYL